MEKLKIIVGNRYLVKEGHELSVVSITSVHLEYKDGSVYWMCSDGHSWNEDHFILSLTQGAIDLIGFTRRTTDNKYGEEMFTYIPE